MAINTTDCLLYLLLFLFIIYYFQYFYGGATGTVRSFNYNGGIGYHLANQDQNVCVR